jgi:hypothetical protein
MAENVIDTLQLDIIVNTKQNGQSITTLRKSLEKLYKFLDGVKDQDFSKISSDIAKIGNSLTPLIKAVNSLDNQGLKNLTSLGTRLQTLNKRMGEIDAKAMAHKFDQMTQAITPFIDKVMSAQEALVALNNVMGGAKTLTKTATPKATTITTPKATTNTNILGGNLGKSLNLGSMVAKLYFVRNITKQLGQDLAKVVQYGIDYQETLNLWQTAMRGNISQARVFTNEMTKAYGISSATLMNYQATFKNMLGALGNISETTAYGLSEALTQMALDFSSLYNVSVESAMTKFQAVLSGQVRPIRTAGYDITEQTLFQLYQSLGGTKTVRQLNQTEKQLLRILAVYEQMERSGATGDLAKTLASSANQLRMMNEQSKEFSTWIGIGFNTLMEKSGILVDINSGLYVATELAKSLAYSMGYVESDWGIEFAEGVDGASKEVDKLKGKLLGFDKFQVLQSGVGADDGTDVTQSLLDAIKNYQKIYEGVENPAVANATKFLEMLGGKLVDVKNEAGEVVGQIWQFPPALTETVKLIGSLASAFAILGLIALEKKLWAVVKGVTGLGSAMTLLRVGGLALVIYGVTNLITKWDELSVGMKIVYGAVTALGVAFMILSSKQTVALIKSFGALIAKAISTAKTFVDMAIVNGTLGHSIASLSIQVAGLTVGLGLLFSAFSDLKNWGDMSGLERASTILKIVAGAAFLAASAIAAFHTAWSVGVAAGAIAVGVAAIVASMATASAAAKDMQKNIEAHANGGLATKGSLFYAGEAGPELVTRTSGGNSTIMNMAQLENAVAKGMFRALAGTQANESEQVVNVGIDGQNLFTIFRGVAKRNGYDLVKVN